MSRMIHRVAAATSARPIGAERVLTRPYAWATMVSTLNEQARYA